MDHNPIIHTLPDGLIIRRSQPADADRLSDFYLPIFTDLNGSQLLDLAVWVRDLLSGRHPIFDPQNFTLVEDLRTGKIVSSLNLIPLYWSYGGIGISGGQIELVATDPAYRRRGLVAAQFRVVHEWADQLGMDLLAITGIPWYYRQFGYEMCIDMDGGRVGFSGTLPLSQSEAHNVVRFRPVQKEDLPFLEILGRKTQQRSLVSAVYDLPRWHYECLQKSSDSIEKKEFLLMETFDGESLGVFCHHHFLGPDYLSSSMITCPLIELKPGIPYPRVLPAVLSRLWQAGQAIACQKGSACDRVGLVLGRNHPALAAAAGWLPQVMDPYAFFIRVPDLPAFLRKISPVLERNLALSPWCGFTGDLKINFYRSGLKVTIHNGQLQAVIPWQSDQPNDGQAAFPDLTFLQLVFGYRSLPELEYAFPDCWAEPDARSLLSSLFPKQPSEIWCQT